MQARGSTGFGPPGARAVINIRIYISVVGTSSPSPSPPRCRAMMSMSTTTSPHPYYNPVGTSPLVGHDGHAVYTPISVGFYSGIPPPPRSPAPFFLFVWIEIARRCDEGLWSLPHYASSYNIRILHLASGFARVCWGLQSQSSTYFY